MFGWWAELSVLLKVLYCIAVPSTVILIIQTILVILGWDDGASDIDIPDDITDGVTDDIDVSDASDFAQMRIFTLQTVIAFLTVFSWSSIVSLHAGGMVWSSMVIGIILGSLAMFLIAKLVQLSAKLQENGTQNLHFALGQSATVYIPIPKSEQGHGKVTFNLQGKFTEWEAVTEGDTELSAGTKVRIIDIVDNKLVVEKE